LPHYQRSHVGHGIGIDGYDVPALSPSSKDIVEEGMVLCVETPYYELGLWGLQVEDMLVVRRNGVESLMSTDGCLMTVTD
jgi:Xaa-Pro aminopeptidase